MWRWEIHTARFNYWRFYLSLRKDIRAKQSEVRGIGIMLKDEVGMSVGCLMLMIVGEIGEIRKLCVDRVTSKMIIRVITKMAVKEISGDNWNRFQKDDRRFNDRGYRFRNWSQKDDFSREDRRNRGSSENFSRGDKRQEGRLNVLKLSDDQNDTIISANEQVKKSRAEVITAQGAKCLNVGIVELNVRIRKSEKPWLFHVLADLEYPCILGVDFINGSKIILDLDRKSLVIPDSQVDKVFKIIEDGNGNGYTFTWNLRENSSIHSAE
ncbi:uncharacterized protein TNCV_3990401 [Trichonephila clavipes]|uniref:Uncharacterized protein n=1 Tax=Trichonephila clavipes TaxID=2585209 RepID=A0A8X6SX75_TRICX|nr:uncharacterized protein TNCV_3990401 [Trichonephila clavipes]